MKVKELIQLLEQENSDAEVIIVSQQNYPIENNLLGVTNRRTVREYEKEEGEGEEYEEGEEDDVLLVEGSQVRYGSQSTWEVV